MLTTRAKGKALPDTRIKTVTLESRQLLDQLAETYQFDRVVYFSEYLLDFAAQYCDTNFEINIQFPYVLCVYSGVKEKIAAQEVRRKEIESNMLSALRKIDNELDNPDSGWKQMSSEDERRFLITSQGTGPVIQDGNEVTIRVRYPGKDGKPEKFDELKTFLVTKGDTIFRGLRQGSSLIIACNGEKKLFEFVDILLVTKLKP